MNLWKRLSGVLGSLRGHRPHRGPIYSITGENTSIDPSDPTPKRRPNGMLMDSGRRYNIFIDGEPGWHRYPWVDPMSLGGGRHPIGFDMLACPDNENVAHRAEVAIVDCEETKHPLAFGIRRYFAFSFFIDPVSEVPRNWILFSQVWQFSARLSPPLELGFRMGRPSDPFVLQFRVRNDQEKDAKERIFFERTVVKGVWYRIVFELLPAHVGAPSPGRVAVWMGEAARPLPETPTALYEGFWGYKPGPTKRGRLPSRCEHEAYDLFNLRFGIYRRKQERRLRMLFDNIVYADSFIEAR